MLRATATLHDGSQVTGPIHGYGGLIGAALSHLEPLPRELAAQYLRGRIGACRRLLSRGRPLPVYEPRPGCVAMYPDWSPAADGRLVAVPVAGTRFELAE